MNFSRNFTYESPIIIKEYEIKAGEQKAFLLQLPEPPNGDETDQAFFYRLKNDRIVGYFNRCTHVTVPMDYGDGEILDTSGMLMCRVHGARYDLETGQPLMGPGRGSLTRILCEEKDDNLYIYGWERV